MHSVIAAAISSSDIKEDNLTKYVLMIYEWVALPNNFYIILAIVVFIILLFCFVYLSSGISSQCPSCKKFHALSLINSELISQREAFKTVSRSDHVSISNSGHDENGFSNSSGTIHRMEQVRVLEQVHKLTYKCNHCRVICSSNKVSETENFYKPS